MTTETPPPTMATESLPPAMATETPPPTIATESLPPAMATENLPPAMPKENVEQPIKSVKIITQEDVLKRFMDSRAKASPPKPEPVKTSTTAAPYKPTGGFEDSPRINKNIFHGVHIPPKYLAHSLRKNGNKYFYVSRASKFEGNINEIASSASKFAAEYVLSRSMESPLSATIGPPLCSNSGLLWGTFYKKISQRADADVRHDSMKTKGIIN